MKTRKTLLTGLAVVLLASIAYPAYAVVTTRKHTSQKTVLTAQGLDSAKNTGWIQMGDFNTLVLYTTFTDANDSVTAMTVECEGSPTAATALGSGWELCSGATSSGTTTLTCPHLWSHTTGVAEKHIITVDNIAAEYVNCTFDATGTPGSVDVVTVSHKRKSL